MTTSQLRLAVWTVTLWLVVTCCQLGWAQQQVTGLKNPVAITMHRGTGYAFVVEQDADRLTRWDGENTSSVAAGLSQNPTGLAKVIGATFRDRNCITLIGYVEKDAKTARVATHRMSADGNLKLDDALTGDLLLHENSGELTAVTSTDLAIYFATGTQDGEPKSRLWQLPCGKASLGKPRIIRVIDGTVTALCMNTQGHIVAAVEEPAGKTMIQFFQVGTGLPLTQLATDLLSVTSLGYEPSSPTLYAAGKSEDREGIFRLDVYFDGTKQVVRGTLVTAMNGAREIVFSEQRNVVLAADEDGARLVSVKFD